MTTLTSSSASASALTPTSTSSSHINPQSHPYKAKTRIVLISDTHNAIPPSSFKLPPGDVLIHAGDLTKTGTRAELEAALSWLDRAEFQVKIVVAGNHDMGLEEAAIGNDGTEGDGGRVDVVDVGARWPEVVYLEHGSATVRLDGPPYTTFTVFGSPFSPAPPSPFPSPSPFQRPPHSAFQYPLDLNPWSSIPPNIDILITHTPPLGHCDADARGCSALSRALARVRPRVHVCGHVHEGRGAERVGWMREGVEAVEGVWNEVRYDGVWRWEDANREGRKLSKIDLRGGGGEEWMLKEDEGGGRDGEVDDGYAVVDGLRGVNWEGGEERMETVVVNAAIMNTSWPYVKGAARFNKPIVVDVDLPVRLDGGI